MNDIIEVVDSINLFYCLALILLTFYIYSMMQILKAKKNKKEEKQEKKETDPDEFTQDQFEKMLMKLVCMNVITTQQYNHLLVKGLPFFK
jgi:uncharacterized membrane protein